jgi:hypothetical protein
MAFLQIMEITTPDYAPVQAIVDEWAKATEGRRTARRTVVARDRSKSDSYFIIVAFDSYEAAMKNSELPETQALAQKMGALVSGSIVFHDADVIDDQTW